MKNIQALTLSKKKYIYNILESIDVEVTVIENPFNLPIDELFTMAARINKKRSFLFVSKLIGKHMPINPNKCLITSALLAVRYYEKVREAQCHSKNELLSAFLGGERSFNRAPIIHATYYPLIIGFAETATSLGHAFSDCFENADYFHTTREVLQDKTPVITFEEEHSHATSHRCYIPIEMIQNDREVILVDDELTTGNTALNMIRSIHSQFPRKEYTVVSILDWRSEEKKRAFIRLEKLLGITIHVVSLISGTLKVTQLKELEEHHTVDNNGSEEPASIEVIHLFPLFSYIYSPSVATNGTVNYFPYLEETGRFGINSSRYEVNQQKVIKAGQILAKKRIGKRALCLGTGEFMYIPMKIAAEMGDEVYYQSTTRSPIFIQNDEMYGVRNGCYFPNPEDTAISNFVYNIPSNYYDDLFLFFEREVDLKNLQPLLKEFVKAKIKSIKLVYFTEQTR